MLLIANTAPVTALASVFLEALLVSSLTPDVTVVSIPGGITEQAQEGNVGRPIRFEPRDLSVAS